MEEKGSSDFDLAGMITQCQSDVERLEAELSETRADLSALERVQRLKDRGASKNERAERASIQEMAQYLARGMRLLEFESITPKGALAILSDAPFFEGLAYKTQHVYATRALNYEPVFRRERQRQLFSNDRKPDGPDR